MWKAINNGTMAGKGFFRSSESSEDYSFFAPSPWFTPDGGIYLLLASDVVADRSCIVVRKDADRDSSVDEAIQVAERFLNADPEYSTHATECGIIDMDGHVINKPRLVQRSTIN